MLAPYVSHIVGIDGDLEMIDHAIAAGRRVGFDSVSWRQMRGEDLPADLGTVDLVTFAQSLHWMQRLQVTTTVRSMLTPNGCCIHVHATTHRGDAGQDALTHPRPPHEAIDQLVRTYLGPDRRAGRSSLPQGTLPQGTTGGDEAAIYRQAGFDGPHHIKVPRGEIIERSIDQIIATTFSLSSSTPHLFGTQRSSFEHELRALLNDASDHGRFSERARDLAFDIWRPRAAFA